MQFFGDAAVSLAPTMLRRVATTFQSTGFSSFLWLQGKVVSFYGNSSDPAVQVAIKETFEQSCAQVFAMLKIQAPGDMPDVIEDYVHLVLQVVDICPDYAFLSPSLPGIFQTLLTGLTLVQPDIIFPTLDLLRSILGHDSLSSPPSAGQPPNFPRYALAIRQVATANGFQLVGLVLTGLVTHFPEDAVHLVISIFRLLAALWPTELATWLPPVVEQIPVSSLPIPAKSQFLTAIGNALATNNMELVKQAVTSLNRASRKTRERTREVVA